MSGYPRSAGSTRTVLLATMASAALAAAVVVGYGFSGSEERGAAEAPPAAPPVAAATVVTPAPAAATEAKHEFPDAWYFSNRDQFGRPSGRRPNLIPLEGKKAPAIDVKGWIGEPQDLEKLEGKVVVVDFWATWCGPCMRAIPENVAMVKKYQDRDFALIGIHDGRAGWQRMQQAVDAKGINYPVAVDDGSKSVQAYKVQFWPTYAVIDHKGIVRAAGLMPHFVEPVVKKLLDEMEAEKK